MFFRNWKSANRNFRCARTFAIIAPFLNYVYYTGQPVGIRVLRLMCVEIKLSHFLPPKNRMFDISIITPSDYNKK